MFLYPKSITLKNIKTQKELFYEFPVVPVDLDNKAMPNKGILLTGSNFIGKTTFIQCLNTSLRNDIGDLLVPAEALREGTSFGSIDLELTDTTGGVYRIINKYEKDISKEEAEVKHSWSVEHPEGQLHSYQSGSVGAFKKMFDYHYISPNEIMMLSATVPGRRKLMKHFLNSVPKEARDKYLEWDAKEQEHFDIRAKKHVSLMKIETVRDSKKLTPVEANTVKGLLALNAKHVDAEKTLKDKEAEVTRYDAKYNAIYPPETHEITNESYDKYLSLKPVWYSGKIIKTNTDIEVATERRKNKLKISDELKNKFDPLNEELKLIASESTFENYALTLVKVKTLYGKLISLDTGVGKEITDLDVVIENYNTELAKLKLDETEAIRVFNEAVAALPEEKPNTEVEQAALDALKTEKAEMDRIVTKQKEYREEVDRAVEAKTAWRLEDDKVVEAREAKKQIILDNNIEVEGFEFSPDGVTLNEHTFAERNVSGAERRIAATQFTMAMNSKVGIAILEEMESLDEKQEQRIFKFAADRGFVVISDNVTKKVIDTVQIETVNIV